MPIDEEHPEFALDLTSEAKRTIQAKLVSSGVAGVLSLIPGVGAAVTEMMSELAIQRTNERINEMFGHFANRIKEVGEDKVDREWFRSEEFQTLLFEALRQLHVTHDREKVEMLGVGLANSGTSGFKSEERKDLFIHFVRDLTRQHLKVLIDLIPRLLQRSHYLRWVRTYHLWVKESCNSSCGIEGRESPRRETTYLPFRCCTHTVW